MPRKWGISGGGRVENPVGKTGLLAGLLAVVVSIAEAVANDPNATNITAAVAGVVLALFGEKVRRQPRDG